ncbi:hypothetical protein DFA_02458 [Cavenderia fasciculata]|uniref:Uncharacterized protein n=1 Tax=Cavenderia fasciculata TaxID=261658 RepID=F4PZI1_CACFS|nr:uncharacterized protein DFA_02458 [Cavenderia fasciculata]EGG19210.1 hypothetical protein DFA_02458 [Cavenderia fasciculata]|eukprot:XP_004366843.1 hypothetical protein DFA_02458 [Cavenderia fasciculata]
MSLLQLSNLLLLHIITKIEDNVDIICLLLTCKKLFKNSSGLKRSIQFKGIGGTPIELMNGYLLGLLKATVNQFNLLSFKDILENSISDQCVIIYNLSDYPKSIQQRLSLKNRVDKSKITTALVDYKSTSLQSIYDDIPSSIETLFINRDCDPDRDFTAQIVYSGYDTKDVDLGSISLLPNLQRLDVSARNVKLSPHTSLKSLTLCYYEIETEKIPKAERSLSRKEEDHPAINLEGLCNLKTLLLHGYIKLLERHDSNKRVEITVPPSLEILSLQFDCVEIPHRCVMPHLEKLYILQRILIDGRISLSTCKSLKKLVLCNSFQKMPADLTIPSTVERLTIRKINTSPRNMLSQMVLPPSLTHLSVWGDYEPIKLPDSLVKLKQEFHNDTVSQVIQLGHLKKLVWVSAVKDLWVLIKDRRDLKLPPSYPPNLETLNLFRVSEDYTIQVPPTIKNLGLRLTLQPGVARSHTYGYPIFSISFRVPKDQPQWLPPTTTELTCILWNEQRAAFRLDEVINHTNVRDLTISFASQTLQFTIQRLDAENKNVLVLEKETLQGGIIRRDKTVNQHYDPIYLYLGQSSYSPFDISWRY